MSGQKLISWTASGHSGQAAHGRYCAWAWPDCELGAAGWAVYTAAEGTHGNPVAAGDAADLPGAKAAAEHELRRLATRRTAIKITVGPARLRGWHYGQTAGSIARRLFGRTAQAVPSADPNNAGQGQVTRTDKYGTHVLASYVEQ